MKRRDFLQSSCQICLLGMLGLGMETLKSCVPPNAIYKTHINQNLITIPKSQLQPDKILLVRAPETDFDIALKSETDGTYKAFLLACTHHENPLNVTGNGFLCPLHGSQFDLEGNVKKGPASLPLRQYHTRIENDAVLIELS